jgi:paraquat-inducible protein A
MVNNTESKMVKNMQNSTENREESIYPEHTAAAQGLVGCGRCFKLNPIANKQCSLCSKTLKFRKEHSLQKSIALLITAALLYIPANIYPIMNTKLLGDETQSTILGGVLLFFDHGSYFVASVIFIASVFIPIAKMMAILWLSYRVYRPKRAKRKELTYLYEVTEFIGKWSMIDVFVVAILVALVQISGIMSITPGLAAQAFAGVVLFTMLSAQQFDIRLIWDNMNTKSKAITPSSSEQLNYE